jgi:hypothetical protein
MAETISLAEAIEVVERLDDDAQAKLVEVVRSRLAERQYIPLAERIAEAEREHAAGHSVVMTVDEIMRKALCDSRPQ